MLPTEGTRRKRRQKPDARNRMTIDAERLYTRAEVATMLHVAELTIFRATHAGKLHSFRIGRFYRYSGAQVLQWLESGGKVAA